MTKKLFKNILVLNSLISIGAATIFAVSCGTVQSKGIEKIKASDKPKAPVKEKETEAPAVTKEDLNKVAESVRVSIRNAQDINFENIKQSDLTFSNFDNDMYDLEVTKFFKNKMTNNVEIIFYIETLDSNVKSDPKTLLLQVNKKENLSDVINNELQNMTVDYANKENTFLKDIQKGNLIFDKYNKGIANVEVVKLKANSDGKSVWVTFRLILKDKTFHTDNRTFLISGFKPVEIVDPTKELNDVLKNLKLDYPEKANTFANKVGINNITKSNYDNTKYKVTLSKLRVNSDNTSISVDVRISLINDSKFESSSKTFSISGFKPVEIIDPTKELKDVLKNVRLIYLGKTITFAIKANVDSIIKDEYDSTKYKVSLSNLRVNSDNTSISVDARISFIDDTKFESGPRTIIIEGFKKPPVSDVPVNFEYANKATIYPFEVNLKNITHTALTDKNLEVLIKDFDLNSDGKSITVEYVILNKTKKTESELYFQTINGFKQFAPKTPELAKIFLTKSQLLTIDEDKKPAFLAAFNNNEATFAFDTTNYKFVVATNGNNLDLTKKSTYTQLGSINKTFAEVNKTFFEQKLLREKIGSWFPKLQEFIEAKKDLQEALFNKYKPLINYYKSVYSKVYTVDKDWLTTLGELIKRNDQKIIFNLNTGQFLVPATEDVAVDFSNPKTYKVLVTAKESFKKEIDAIIIDQLSSADVSMDVIDTILSKKISVFYTLQKTNEVIVSSITFSQKVS